MGAGVCRVSSSQHSTQSLPTTQLRCRYRNKQREASPGSTLHATGEPGKQFEESDKMVIESLPRVPTAGQAPGVNRNRPYGAESWQKQTAKRLGLEHSMRSRGRPREEEKKNVSFFLSKLL